MKINTFIQSSLLVLAAIAKVNSKAISVDSASINQTVEKVIAKPTSIIPLPTVSPHVDCPLGLGVVMNQYLECERKNGRFYKKFHPYPECYSDYVCFIPTVLYDGDEAPSSCIYIDGKPYCKADVSNIKSCRVRVAGYNFKQCVKEASEIFSDFVYETHPPVTSTTTTTTTRRIRPTAILTEVLTPIPNPTAYPVLPIIDPTPTVRRECLLGQGVVATQYFQCERLGGKFYKKFHGYPECYSDYVCFIPSNNVGSLNGVSKCIIIDGGVYCSAEISNIKYCKNGTDDYNFNKCVKTASEIFSDFSYAVVPPINPTILPTIPVKPTILPTLTIKPTIITKPIITKITAIIPTVIPTKETAIIKPTVVPKDYEAKEKI